MIIEDFMRYTLEDENYQLVEIYDCETATTVYKGLYRDMFYKYRALEVESWNVIADCGICFNVCIE